MEKERLDYATIAPESIKGLLQIEKYIAKSGLDRKVFELVKLRASQINKCAYCIDMHTKDARNDGETEQRLYGLSAWKETPFYSEKERAALAWTEALTLISENEISDSLYNKVREHFDDQETVALTMAIVAINSWNRLAIGFKNVVGNYQSKK